MINYYITDINITEDVILKPYLPSTETLLEHFLAQRVSFRSTVKKLQPIIVGEKEEKFNKLKTYLKDSLNIELEGEVIFVNLSELSEPVVHIVNSDII